ncbi:hypothetical protein KAM622c_11510 [Klebsiella quasipneumoniae subsp. quasipneumoniae]|nr:hypothetical protein KAM622c_11510 [Klebsiella quasipneumoniae subsp. quasipneumoniae]
MPFPGAMEGYFKRFNLVFSGITEEYMKGNIGRGACAECWVCLRFMSVILKTWRRGTKNNAFIFPRR